MAEAGKLQANPSKSGKLQASPSKSGKLQASPSKSGKLQASPSKSGKLQASPSKSGKLQASPSKSGNLQASPSKSGNLQASPSKSGKLQASPSKSGKLQASPSKSGKLQASPSKSGKLQASPSTGSRPRSVLRPSPAVAARDKKLCVACVVIALLSIATIVVMSMLYIDLKEVKSPNDQPMEQLRIMLASALNRPDLQHSSAMQVAEELKNLPSHIQIAFAVYNERKKKYHDLFHKAMRSSSGPWKLHGRSLYYFSKGTKTWYDAESFCISRDAHLASVRDDEEQNFITSQLPHAAWIGLTEGDEEGTWGWSDGARLGAQYWSDGRPKKAELFGESRQDCTLMVPSLTVRNWHDESCHNLYGWICKENLDLGEP